MKTLTALLMTLCLGLFIVGCGGADDAGQPITPAPTADGAIPPADPGIPPAGDATAPPADEAEDAADGTEPDDGPGFEE